MLYQILEKTPFSVSHYPTQPYRPIAEFQMQMAEFDLKLNKKYYYEQAVRVADHFLYPLEIAERIIAYWQNRYPFAEYQLQAHAEQRLQADGLPRSVSRHFPLENHIPFRGLALVATRR